MSRYWSWIPRQRLPMRDYLFFGGSGLVLIGLIVLYVLEFPFFSNTFGVKSLVLGSMLVGAMIGYLVAVQFQKKEYDLTERIQLFVFSMVLCAVFAPLFGSLSNRLLGSQIVQMHPFEFVEEVPYAQDRFGFMFDEEVKPDGYAVFFLRKGNPERVKTLESLFSEKERGEQIELPIKRGLWGFEYVDLK